MLYGALWRGDTVIDDLMSQAMSCKSEPEHHKLLNNLA